MLARFFASRPVFAWVIAISVILAGIVSIRALPVAAYPDVALPNVRVTTGFPGASAQTVENSVTQVLEQQLTGIDGLLYFSSSSNSAGQARIDVAFKQGTNPDTAQVQVQNKIQQAIARLPPAVQQQGIVVSKSLNSFLMVVLVYDATDRATQADISDYVASAIQDSIARVDGVGSTPNIGKGSYAMRIWLDPSRLHAFSLMPSDVETAIATQNVQVSAGKIGQQPALPGQQLSATVTAQSKLETPQQFRDIILKHDPSGATVRLGDVARVELGSETYDRSVRLNRHPAGGFQVMLASSANAMAVASAVKQTMSRLADTMPAGWKVAYLFDTTKFIRLSILEVVKTLLEAIALVVFVMFVFLQSWRVTLIPVIAVPVVLLGTFSILQLLGYTINTLTLFAMVLSIGLLVDDAIVVVENTARLMRDEQLSPLDATVRSMKEVTGALIGIATVLSAVFLPMAFFSGSTGVIYRQFSVTLIASMLLSVLVALTISPAMCASLLRGQREPRASQRGPFGWFNRGLERVVRRYQGGVARMLRGPFRWLVPYLAIVGAMAWLLLRLPAGFLPIEDQGYVSVMWTLPAGAVLQRTAEVGDAVEHQLLDVEQGSVAMVATISGSSYSGVGQNTGIAYVDFKDWDERPGAAGTVEAVARRVNAALAAVRDARVFVPTPPPIDGLGSFAGFDLQLQAVGIDRAALARARDQLLAAASKDPRLTAVRRADLPETPQLHIDIDPARAVAHGVAVADIASTLAAAWGGVYVNDFVDRGLVKRVFVQGDAQFRSKPEDLDAWSVRGESGAMTPFSAFATTRWAFGAESLSRFNGLAAFDIQGLGAPGVSSGEAMAEIARLAGTIPGTTSSWSGLAYQEQLASGQTLALYGISILVIFLCLAALYESWSVPFSVLLVIPLGVVGAVLAATLRGLDNDVYFRVALITTIGLSSKNAILIVEFAEAAYHRGASLVDAALTGARLRLRPILMTSLAFVAGVTPLVLSTGPGANSRVSIGTGIVGGTVTGTAIAVFFVPVFFVIVRRLVRTKQLPRV